MSRHVVINAIHTKTGGGLVFFNHIVPLLAQDKDLKLTVIAHPDYATRLEIPDNVALHLESFPDGFLKMLIWEQVKLPSLVRKLGGEVTFNVANYCPLFAPKPVVYVTNNPEVRHYVKRKSEKFYWWALIWMTRLSLMFSPKALCNGNYMKQVYAGGLFSFLQKKMIKATTACDYKLTGEVQKKAGQIIAIGDFYTHKNYLNLIHAFAQVKEKREDARLVIVGRPVNKSVAARMEVLLDEYELSGSVMLRGALSHAEAQEWLAESDVYVSPSDAEAFSLTLLEAMTVGTASVVKKHNFQREVAGDLGAEYVNVSADPKQQAELLAQGMLNVLNDDTHRQRIVDEGLKLSQEFSWKKSSDTVAKVLKSV